VSCPVNIRTFFPRSKTGGKRKWPPPSVTKDEECFTSYNMFQGIIPEFTGRDWGKPLSFVRRASNLIYFLTAYISFAGLECYHYTNLLNDSGIQSPTRRMNDFIWEFVKFDICRTISSEKHNKELNTIREKGKVTLSSFLPNGSNS